MIGYKQLNRDINNIIGKYKEKNFYSFEVIQKIKEELKIYYEKNIDNIEKDALLKKHKVLSSDLNVMNNNFATILYGLFGSFLLSFVEKEAEQNPEEYSKLIQIIVLILIVFFILLFFGSILIFIVRFVNKHIYDYKTVYIDTFHVELIEKYLFEEVHNDKERKKHDNKPENQDELSEKISFDKYRQRNKYLFFWLNSFVFWFKYYFIDFLSIIKGTVNIKLNRINDLNKRNELLKKSDDEANSLNDENIKNEVKKLIKGKKNFANNQMNKLTNNKGSKKNNEKK